MTEDKGFKSIDEQLEILRSRGLFIDNEEIAQDFLLCNNYYRLSGYSLTLRCNNIFSPAASFQNIIDIYNFDYEMRHLILKYIEIIEVTIKSVYAYEFTKIHGATGYLNSAFFTHEQKHLEILTKCNLQKKRRLSHEAYLKHFITDLKQDIPLWAYIDLLTIADISFLFSISESEIKQSIAEHFKLYSNQAPRILGHFMHSMTIIRNLCAHGSRIYNRLFEQKPSLNKKEQSLLMKQKDGSIDNSHFYGFFLIMKRLLKESDFLTMKKELIILCTKYPFVRMSYYGFRYDWKEKV